MRHFLIDTDTASDDAVALLIALTYPDIQVEAITVVAGNVPLPEGVQNALYTLELAGKPVPVYAGASKPLLRPLQTAQFIHGQDGMGDIGLHLQGRFPAEGHAVEAIIETIRAYPNEIELVTLGPLTNIALALSKDPALAGLVKQCTIMGGIGYGHGNIAPVSEYNIWTDPEAAQIVFQSGMPITMVGWDMSRNYAWFGDEDVAVLRALDTPLAHFAVDIQRTLVEFAVKSSKLAGFNLPDPIAMAIALDKTIAIRSESLYVEVVLANDLTRGQTIVDHTQILGKRPNANVILEASRERFLSMLHKALQND